MWYLNSTQADLYQGWRKEKRGEPSSLEVRIHGSSTPVPKQFPKYISNATNKVSLAAFLTEVWVNMAKKRLPEERELVVGGGMADGHLTLSIKNRHCHEVAELEYGNEEADLRMLVHADHTGREAQIIANQSPDTDVLLLCVTHCDEIGSELWFRTGFKDRLWL